MELAKQRTVKAQAQSNECDLEIDGFSADC